jgi:uncharacterized repeat protein (TIGR01451 family)
MNHKLITFRLAVVGIIVAIALMGILYVDQLAARASTVNQIELFSDDFSGDLSQWSNPVGDWSIDQGELVGYGGGVGGFIYAGNTSWTDYVLQAKVIFVNSNAILVFRSTGNLQNEYYIELWQEGGEYDNTYVIAKYQDGVQYDLSGGHIYSPVSITNPSVVEVIIKGDHIRLHINGEYVGEVSDPDPLPNGRIGMGVVWNYSVRFDDVLVTTIPPIMLLPPEKDKFGWAGDLVTYTLGVENYTGLTDSFDLELLPGNIYPTILLSYQLGPIADGERITFTASVEVPPDAQPAYIDHAIIQATSANSPSITATAMVNTITTSGKLAYIPMANENALALVDTILQATIGYQDLAQYGCSSPQRARLTPDGKELYVTCEGSQTFVVLETTNLSLVATIDRPGVCHQDVVFDPFGAFALANNPGYCGGFLQIDIIDTATHSIVNSIPTLGYRIESFSAHPFLPLIYAAGTQDGLPGGGIVVINTDSFSIQTIIQYGESIRDVQISPDGHWLYANERYGIGLAKIDLNTNTIVDTLPGYGKYGLEISPDGSRIYASEGPDGIIDIIDAATLEYITTIDVGAGTFESATTCDGKELYVALESSLVPIIDTQTNTILKRISIPGTSSGYGIAICPRLAGDIFARKTVDTQTASPGEIVNYAITTINYGNENVNNTVITDTLPLLLTYVEGSLNTTSGMVNYQDGVINWTGPITASTTVTISFGATVSPTAALGIPITNEAVFNMEGNSFKRSVPIDIVPYKTYISCAFRACLPTFNDDFSNPASGWGTESGDDYWMGYQDGEYYIAVNQGWIAWSVQDFGVSDYHIEVDARPAGVNSSDATALLFGATDNGFYLLEFSDGWFALYRIDTYYWDWIPLIDWTYSTAIHPGFSVNRMGVVRAGSNITIYSNGQQLGSVTDGTYQGTWLGMLSDGFSGYFDGRFDNFTLYTGNCIGAKSASLPQNRSASFDTIFIEPRAGHTRP